MTIYIRPLDEITWDDIESFCQQNVAEGAHLDYKQDFPARLENTIAAMANTLGGIVLIGVAENAESKPVVPVNGITFERGLGERVTNIILTNITPPVFPEIGVYRNSTGDQAIVLLRIPQSHQTPHAVMHNTQVYVRTGNRNTPEALASLDEIEWLRDRRQQSEDLRERLYMRANDRFASLSRSQLEQTRAEGRRVREVTQGLLTLSVCPVYPKDRYRDPPEMKDTYQQIQVSNYCDRTGTFPLPDDVSGTIVQDGFVLHHTYESDLAFHTEINCFGLYFYKQAMALPWGRSDSPIKVIRASELFCRLDQFVDSAVKYYRALGYWGPLEFRMHLDRIQGCGLGRYHPSEASTPPVYSPDSEVLSSQIVAAPALEAEKSRIVLRASQQVAWAFGWEVSQGLLDIYYAKTRPRK